MLTRGDGVKTTKQVTFFSMANSLPPLYRLYVKNTTRIKTMNAKTHIPGFARRLGRSVRRLAGQYKAFEAKLVRRADDTVPAIGFKAFRVLFWVLKFAVIGVLFFAAAYIALCLLILLGIIKFLNRLPTPKAPAYGNIGHPMHKQYYPGHSAYTDEQPF